jgi:hypothetical protein
MLHDEGMAELKEGDQVEIEGSQMRVVSSCRSDEALRLLV